MGIPLNIDPNKPPYELYDHVDYKVFWKGWQQYKLDQAEHAVVRDMLPVSGRRLIDIGCGYGRLSDCYLDRFQQVVMFDGSIPLLREARENTVRKAIYVAGDLQHLPFRTASFDSIIMVRVFHHVIDSIACLSELHRVLSGGGRLVMTYRNKMYPVYVLKWLAHPTPDSPFNLEPSGIGTTLISHHPTYIKQILSQTDFTDLQYRGLGALDRFANKVGPFGKYAPTGERLAPLLGRLMIALWIFCRATAKGSSILVESDKFEDLLMCLVCGGNLRNDAEGYTCLSCCREYPIIDGILDFRINCQV